MLPSMLFPNNKNASRNAILQKFRVNSYNEYFLLMPSKQYNTNHHALNIRSLMQQTEKRSFEAITGNSER